MSTSSQETVERFLWMSASSDSEDYEMTISDVKVNGHSKTKKRIKADRDVSTEVSSNEPRRSKKRKLSISSELELKVKAELASDTESARRRRKKENHIKGEYEAPDTASSSQELADNDSYLELRVKEESFVQPSQHKEKKKKKNLIEQAHSDNDQSFFSSTHIEVKQERDKMSSESENIDGTSNKKKKKKHKKDKKKEFEFSADETVVQSPLHNGIEAKKKHRSSLSSSHMSVEFSADETVVQSPLHNGIEAKKKHRSSLSSSHMSVDNNTPFKNRLSSQRTSIHEAISVSPTPQNDNTNIGIVNSDNDSYNSEKCSSGNKVSRSKSMKEISIPEGPTRKLRIPERIAFEEDFESNLQSEFHSETKRDVQTVKHGLVNKYIRDGNLRSIATIIPSSILIEDDDVWMIKCPREITSSALGAMQLSVEGKGKIKIDGITYDSSIEPDMGHLNVQLCPEGKYIIKSVPVKGVLNLRRRIPKPHLVLDNTMVNKHQFIPLPETKLRHPLFGADYQAAVKLPSRAARRLRGLACQHADAEIADTADAPSQTSTCKKKKRKRKRSEVDEDGVGAELEMEAEAPPSKRKRPKREIDAGVWDSAQAIEDNLFNF